MDLTGHVQLLLGAPGQAAPSLPASPWRLWTPTDHGLVDPTTTAAGARPSPMAPRAEKALVAAVAADDVDALGRLAAQPGPAQAAARLLHAGRLATVDTVLAAEVLISVLAGPADPAGSKALRRTWGDLQIGVTLAPGVPALAPVGRLGVGLLLADVCVAGDRPTDAVAVLRQIPPHPAVVLALAGTLLTMGEHGQVVEVTARMEEGDELAALALVARSVAARHLADLSTALDAASGALAAGAGYGAVLATALEERARVYSQAGAEAAARADLEVLAALTQGAGEVEVPAAVPLRSGPAGPAGEDDELHRARDRVRRRIVGVGAPGTFGGRHHSTYRDDVADLFSLGQVDAVEELLLGLIDAVEDEVAETGAELDPTFFLTLVDLYEDRGRSEDLLALRERFEAARARGTQGSAGPARSEAGEGAHRPAPFDAPPPDGADSVSVDGRPIDVGAAVEQLLVSVGVASAPGPVTAERSEPVARPRAERAGEAPNGPAAETGGAEPGATEPPMVPGPEAAPPVVVSELPKPAPEDPVAAGPVDQAGASDVADGPANPTEPDPETAIRPPGDEGPDADAAPAGLGEARTAIERVARGPRIRSL